MFVVGNVNILQLYGQTVGFIYTLDLVYASFLQYRGCSKKARGTVQANRLFVLVGEFECESTGGTADCQTPVPSSRTSFFELFDNPC